MKDPAKLVLLVDNDPPFIEIARRELLTRGYLVAEAFDGLEGIEKALQEPPDIAVVDLVMPRVGGSEVVSFMRQNPYLSAIPIILLSGVVVENRSEMDSLHVDLVLSKGSLAETIPLLLSGIEKLANGPRETKETVVKRNFRARTPVSELLDLRRDLTSLLEGVHAGVVELNPDWRIGYVNRRAEEILGLDRVSLIGSEILSIFPKVGVSELRTLLARFGEERDGQSRAMTVMLPGRAIRTVLTPVRSAGAVRSIVVTLSEVPPHAEVNAQAGRFPQYLCHEMRASLLIIEGYLRSLVAKVSEAARADHEMLLFLARETARLLRLLNEASEFDRLISELLHLEVEPLDFLHVVKEAVLGVSVLAEAQGIQIDLETAPSVPPVRGNRDKLLQVLYNLLLNSLKFTPYGGSVSIQVSVSRREVVTTVVDTGRGISAGGLNEIMAQAQRPELFLPLKGRRIGLGLPIAVQVVRAHGGRLFAESTVDVGSRFSFTLPLEPQGRVG